MTIIINGVKEGSHIKLPNTTFNVSSDERVNKQQKNVLLDSWPKSLVRPKRSPADREGAGPSRENRSEVLENIRHLHYGYLHGATQALIAGSEEIRIRQANALRMMIRHNASEQELDREIQERIRRAISRVSGHPNVGAAHASVENYIVLFPEHYERFLREGQGWPNSSIDERIRFALSSRNYLVINAIPQGLRWAYNQQRLAGHEQALPNNQLGEPNQQALPNEAGESNQRPPNSPSISEDSGSTLTTGTTGYSSLRAAFSEEENFSESEADIPQVYLTQELTNEIHSVLQSILSNGEILFTDINNMALDDYQNVRQIQDRINQIRDNLRTISNENLVAYVRNLATNTRNLPINEIAAAHTSDQAYQRVDEILDVYNLINNQLSINNEVTAAYRRARGQFNSVDLIESLYTRLRLVLNVVAREGILRSYLTEYNHDATTYSHRINKILKTQYSNAIDVLLQRDAEGGAAGNNFLGDDYSNQRIDTLLESRHPGVIDTILTTNVDILRDYILDPSGAFNSERIGRILRTRYQRVINGILPDTVLTHYVNEFRSNNLESHYTRVSRILESRNPTAIRLILPDLEGFINSPSTLAGREVRIGFVLSARNREAINILLTNGSLRHSFLISADDIAVRNLYTEMIIQSGSREAIDYLFQIDHVEDYAAGITDEAARNRFVEQILTSGSRTGVDFLFERGYIENYAAGLTNQDARNNFLEQILASGSRAGVNFLFERGYIENYAAGLTNQDARNNFLEQILASGSDEALKFILRRDILRRSILNVDRYLRAQRIDQILRVIRSSDIITSSSEDHAFLRSIMLNDAFYTESLGNLERLINIANGNLIIRAHLLQGVLYDYITQGVFPVVTGNPVDTLLDLSITSPWIVDNVLLQNNAMVLQDYVRFDRYNTIGDQRIDRLLNLSQEFPGLANALLNQNILGLYIAPNGFGNDSDRRIERLIASTRNPELTINFLTQNDNLRNYILRARDGYARDARIESILNLANVSAVDAISSIDILRNYVLRAYNRRYVDQPNFDARVERILNSGSRRAVDAISTLDIISYYIRGGEYTHLERLLTLADNDSPMMDILSRNDNLRNYVLSANNQAARDARVERILNSGSRRAVDAISTPDILRGYINGPHTVAPDAASLNHQRTTRVMKLRAAGVSQDMINRAVPPKRPHAASEDEGQLSFKYRRPGPDGDNNEGNGGGSMASGPSAGECLGSASGRVHRRKRGLEAEGCYFHEEDIKKFNKGKAKPAEPNEIIVGSDELLELLEHPETNELQRDQLIELASEAASLAGSDEAQTRVNGLINDQKAFRYLEKSSHISGLVMGGMMWKNMLADLYNGNYKGAAINAAFVAAGPATKGLGLIGSKLILNGQYARLGRSLMVGAPFLLQGANVGFVIYDLVSQIQRYKQGDPDAMVKIVSDGLVITLQGSEIVLSSLLTLELMEANAFTTIYIPGVNVAVAVLFVGTDVYMAVKQVGKEDKLIHLTGDEKLIEGIRHFVGIGADTKLARLMQEKKANNEIFNEQISFLKNNTAIQKIIVPTMSLKKVCHDERQVASWKCDTHEYVLVPGPCHLIPEGYKTGSVCENQVELALNNEVELDEKVEDIRWSRTRPDVTEGNLFCAPQGNDDGEEPPEAKVYRCDKAMGIEYNESRTDNIVLISLGDGHDNVEGFPNSNHLVTLGNDHKNMKLGSGDDSFVLMGNNTWGILHGGGGINTLDLGFFAKNESAAFIDLSTIPGVVYTSNFSNESYLAEVEKQNTSSLLQIESIQRFFLRENKRDRINATCSTLYIDGNGGDTIRNVADEIYVDDKQPDCRHEMKLMARSGTIIVNYNNNKDSKFSYIVPSMPIEHANFIDLVVLKGNQSSHQFVFPDYSLFDLETLIKSSTDTNIHVEFKTNLIPENSTEAKLHKFDIFGALDTNNLLFKLSNNTEIVNKFGEFVVYQVTDLSVAETINDYASLAKRLNLTLVSYFLSTNETLTIGHCNHDILYSNPDYRSHLVGNGGENVFVVTPPDSVLDKSQLPLPEVVLYDSDDENLIDTLDLHLIKEKVEKDLSATLEIKTRQSLNNQDIVVELYCVEPNCLIAREGVVLTVILKNALRTKWHKRLHVNLDGSLMKFNALVLKYLPLEFIKQDRIYIYPEAVKENQMLVIHKPIGDYRFARAGDSDTLLITNAFDIDITENERYFISLDKYYLTPKLATLSIQFNDKTLVLKDEAMPIAWAQDYSDMYAKSRHERYMKHLNFTNPVVRSHVRRSHGDVYPEMVSNQKTTESVWDWIKSQSYYYLLPVLGMSAAVLGVGMGFRHQMRNRLRRNAIPLTAVAASVEIPLLNIPSAESISYQREEISSSINKPQPDPKTKHKLSNYSENFHPTLFAANVLVRKFSKVNYNEAGNYVSPRKEYENKLLSYWFRFEQSQQKAMEKTWDVSAKKCI